jgi:hypothetical protein
MRGLNQAFVSFVQSASLEGDYGLLWLGDVPDPVDLEDEPEEYPAWAYEAMTIADGVRGMRGGSSGVAPAIEDNPYVLRMYSTDSVQLSTDLDYMRRHFETLSYSESRSAFTQDYYTLIGAHVIGLTPPAPHPKKKDAERNIVYAGDVRIRLQTQRSLGEF